MQIKKCLKPDGVFLGATFGENTLQELRHVSLFSFRSLLTHRFRSSIYLAEQEREGGFATHVSPFTRVSDIGNLITRAKLALPTIDMEEMKMAYSDMFVLLKDLKGMGESNAVIHRRQYLT